MIKRSTTNLWVNYIIPISTFLVGLIAPLAFEKVTDRFISTDLRLILSFIIVQGLLVVLGLMAVGMFLRTSETQREISIKELKEIRRQIGLSTQFVSDLPRGDGTGALYKKATEMVSKAEKEILVLHHNISNINWREPEEYYRSEEWIRARNRYYQALIGKCQQHRQDTFFYRRILQIPDSKKIKDDTVKRTMIGKGMAEHCEQLLQFIKQNPEAALLKYSPLFLAQTLVLIDERYILWEIDAIDPDTKVGYMDAINIFDDIEGNFVSYLKKFFLKIDAQATKVKSIDLEN